MIDQIAEFAPSLIAKSTVVLAVAFAAAAALRRLSAQERHLVWVVAIAALLLLPALAALAPKIGLPTDELLSSVGFAVTPSTGQAEIEPGATAPAPGAPMPLAATPAAEQTVAVPTKRRDLDWGALLVAAYAAVAAIVLGWFGARVRRVGRLLRTMPELQDRGTSALIGEIRERLDIRRDIRTLISPSGGTPWTWGIIRPVVVLPRGFEGWRPENQRNAVIHELAHIARLDLLTTIVAHTVCALYWFHPLAWLALRRMKGDAESACDDRVLLLGGQRRTYAQQLLDIANEIYATARVPRFVASMADTSSMSTRIQAVLSENSRRKTMTKFGTTVVFVAALALLVPLAGLESQEPEGPSVADLSDPAFQALAQSGPATEDDLRLIIEAYVANEATESARQVLVDWITRESGTTLGHSPCGLCTEKLTAMGRPWRDEMQRLILDAFDDVQQRAYDQNDGELLVRLAKIAVDSKNNDVITLGAYYLSEGLRVGGGDATASELAISYLYELGELEQARNLAERLQNDPTSPLFQSESASRWIQYINNTLARRNRLASIVLGGGAVVASDSDYLPLIKEAPRYPASAAAAGIEGHAIVEYSVNERGRPEDARVVESSDPAFDEPSLASVELYRYMPRIVGGTPVDVPGVRTVIRYRLQK